MPKKIFEISWEDDEYAQYTNLDEKILEKRISEFPQIHLGYKVRELRSPKDDHKPPKPREQSEQAKRQLPLGQAKANATQFPEKKYTVEQVWDFVEFIEKCGGIKNVKDKLDRISKLEQADECK